MEKKHAYWCAAILAAFLSTWLVASTAQAQCVWEWGLSFPVAERKGAAGMKDQFGTLFALGGRPFVGEQASVHYLPAGGQAWQSGQPLEQAVMNPAAGLTALGEIMVASGWIQDDSGGLGIFPLLGGVVYDAALGEVRTTAALPAGRGRAFHGYTSDNLLRLYLVGGITNNDDVLDLVDRYDALSDAWTALPSMPASRYYTAAVYDGQGHILAIGGRCCSDSSGTPRSNVYSFDIAGGTWSEIASQPAALYSQSAVLGADGRIYVMGGTTGSGSVSSVFIFDPTSGLWSLGPDLQVARYGAAAALGSDGYVYVMGGYTSGSVGTNTVERLGTVALGTDCNSNSVPDECETDCNNNGVPDDCDIDPSDPDGDGLVSPDINGNGVPDECEECLDHPDCNDDVGCTDDTCVSGSCVFTANDANCADDGFFCNGTEVCDAVDDCQPGAEPCLAESWCEESLDICIAYGDGDFDSDGDVDMMDFRSFQECFQQPAGGGCQPGDMAGDNGIIDLSDFCEFAAAMQAM